MKKYKYFWYPVLVLLVITLVAGLLLGLFSEITKVDEQELRERVESKLLDIYHDDLGFEEVKFESSNADIADKIDYFFKAKSKSDVYIAVANSTVRGYGGTVQLYVVFEGNQIIKIEKGKISESPGISDQAFSDSLYSKFYGVDLTQINGFIISGSGSDYTEVDGISSATFSSTAVINCVSNAVRFYKEFKGVA